MAEKPDPHNWREKAARKAVPKKAGSWLKEVMGVISFIATKPQLTDANGKQWYASMSGYYTARIDVLAANVPRGMVKARALALIKNAREGL